MPLKHQNTALVIESLRLPAFAVKLSCLNMPRTPWILEPACRLSADRQGWQVPNLEFTHASGV